MIKEILYEQLYNKIPQSAKIAIFGACILGSEIYKDILINRKDVVVKGFIDNNKEGEFCNLPILKLADIVKQKDKYDVIIIASLSAQYFIVNILDIYDIPFIPINRFIMNLYEGKNTILNDTNYHKVLSIFSDSQDKELFSILFQYRLNIPTKESLADYFNKHYPISKITDRTVKNQYLDKINKENVKTIFDLGFNSGINAIAYNKILPNVAHIYGFEPIYDICKINVIDSLLPKDKICIVNRIVGETKGTTSFFIDVNDCTCSLAGFSSINKGSNVKYKEIKADVTTIDDFCKENNVYPDLIKMDIEGSELPALKGGINVIKKMRPQLSISSYHSDADFIDIPLYLYENLENYTFKLGQYSSTSDETVLYAIPNELI